MNTTLQVQVSLADAVYKIAGLARDEDPKIARVYIETSDQGEYLTASNVTYEGEQFPDAVTDYLDEQVECAVDIEDWANALSWDDAHGTAPGWHTLNDRGGYYYIDVAEALAAEAPVEIKPVDLVRGVLAQHSPVGDLAVLKPGCICGRVFDTDGDARTHVAEKIVEVLS